MKVEVSNGEIVDKISILLIKVEKNKDSNKINNIDKELKQLLPYLDKIGISMEEELFKKLKKVNLKLWDIEDKLRKLESQKKFNNEFIEIEFAINKKNTLYLFQVRPIIKNIKNNISINFANNTLAKLEKKILKLQKKHTHTQNE